MYTIYSKRDRQPPPFVFPCKGRRHKKKRCGVADGRHPHTKEERTFDMNTGKLFPAHGLQDAVVDEVGLRPFNRLQDLVYLLSGTEPVVGHSLALAPGAFPGTAAPALFLNLGNEFHNFVVELKNNDYLCSEKPEGGEVSLPFGCQISISNRILTFQILNESASLIRLQVFRFSYSFQGFRIPLFCHLLTLQRYEIYLNYANKIKRIFKKIITFFAKNLLGKDIIPIFATFKLIRGSKSQVSQPAIFMPVLYRNDTTVTASEGGNTPGVLRIRLEQRVVRSFIYVQNLIRMNQTIQLGQVRPSVFSKLGKTVKNRSVELGHDLATRLSSRNEWFSAFTQEEVTNKHVALAHLYMAVLLVACMVAGWLEGGEV